MTARGFPHSEISGSLAVGASPEPIVACTVLHRHSAPRHPPPALDWHCAAVSANRLHLTPVGCPNIIGTTRPARLRCGVAGFPNQERPTLTQSNTGGAPPCGNPSCHRMSSSVGNVRPRNSRCSGVSSWGGTDWGTLTPEAWQEADLGHQVRVGQLRPGKPVGADRPRSGAPFVPAEPTGVSQLRKKGGDPAARSRTATLLRLHPNHQPDARHLPPPKGLAQRLRVLPTFVV